MECLKSFLNLRDMTSIDLEKINRFFTYLDPRNFLKFYILTLVLDL